MISLTTKNHYTSFQKRFIFCTPVQSNIFFSPNSWCPDHWRGQERQGGQRRIQVLVGAVIFLYSSTHNSLAVCRGYKKKKTNKHLSVFNNKHLNKSRGLANLLAASGCYCICTVSVLHTLATFTKEKKKTAPSLAAQERRATSKQGGAKKAEGGATRRQRDTASCLNTSTEAAWRALA